MTDTVWVEAPGHFDGDGCRFPAPGHLMPAGTVPAVHLDDPEDWATLCGLRDEGASVRAPGNLEPWDEVVEADEVDRVTCAACLAALAAADAEEDGA